MHQLGKHCEAIISYSRMNLSNVEDIFSLALVVLQEELIIPILKRILCLKEFIYLYFPSQK